MRMRRKPWARPELAACPYFIDEPHTLRGRWAQAFSRPQPVWLELGCGKGSFLTQMAEAFPGVNFLGIDIKSEVLAVARRTLSARFQELGRPVDNVLLTAYDIERIDQILSPQDQVDRIFINFCNPWPKARDHKKRLTHPRWLVKYQQFLRPGGELWFKTDDDDLFLASHRYLGECGFVLAYETRDLHRSGFSQSPPTEHERMFTQEGIPTKFLIARWPGKDAGGSRPPARAGEAPSPAEEE